MKDPERPPIVRQVEDPHALAAKFNACEKAAVAYTAEHIKAQGERLIKMKEQVGHGDWTRFVAKNIHIGIREVQRYMKLAKNDTRVVFESLREGLQLLAEDEEESAPAESGTAKLSGAGQDESEKETLPRPSRNGSVAPSDTDPDLETETETDDDAEDEPEAPPPTPDPAVTSPDQAESLKLLKFAQEGVKGIGMVVRSLDGFKQLDKYRKNVQELKDFFTKHTRGTM